VRINGVRVDLAELMDGFREMLDFDVAVACNFLTAGGTGIQRAGKALDGL